MSRKKNKMPLWLQQAIVEFEVLENKIQKLNLFMQSKEFARLNIEDQRLLSVQQTTMMSLVNLIGMRIDNHIEDYPEVDFDSFPKEAFIGEEFGISDEQLSEYMEEEEEYMEDSGDINFPYIDLTKEDKGLVS